MITRETHTEIEAGVIGRLLELRGQGISWRNIAKFDPFVGIPGRTLWKMCETRTISPKWRTHFGLPQLIEIPPCPLCGLAHTHAHGQDVYDPTTHHVTKNRNPKPRAPRIAIRKDDMQSAARSIVNHMTASDVDVLIVELRDLLLGENPLDKKNYREEE